MMTDDTPRDPLAARIADAIFNADLDVRDNESREFIEDDEAARRIADLLEPFRLVTLDATRPSGDKTLRAALESLVAASRDHFIVTFRYASGRRTDDEMDAATRALLDATEVGAAALATPSSAPTTRS